MSLQFKAEDNTKMTFEMVKEISGCQQFKITIESQPSRSITLVGLDTEAHYKTLEILLAWGMCHLKDFELWVDSMECYK